MYKTMAAVVLALTAIAPAFAAMADEAQFERDLAALTAHPHRLSGTDEAWEAAAYVEDRLTGLGIEDVLPLDMPVWQTRSLRCELLVGDTAIGLAPLRPNVIASPVTPEDGLTGPMLYVGRGDVRDYGERSPEGAIVVLDYDSGRNWELAFALGAHAVIFLEGEERATPVQPKHAGVPGNLVRLYADADAQAAAADAGLDLRRDRAEATVHSEMQWERRLGRNLVARIPGTDPSFERRPEERETLVLAAHYDTFGTVPTRSPGARSAANVAALLELAERIAENPPRRDVVLMFLDNQARYHQGAREVYWALAGDVYDDEGRSAQAQHHAQEHAFVQQMRDWLARDGLLYIPKEDETLAGRLRVTLEAVADAQRGDLRQQLKVLRLEMEPLRLRRIELRDELEALSEQIEELDEDIARETGEERASRVREREQAAEQRAAGEHELAVLDRRLAPIEARETDWDAQRLRWDDIRRELHHDRLRHHQGELARHRRGEFEEWELRNDEPEDLIALADSFEPIYAELERSALEHFDRRLEELEQLRAIDVQREALHAVLGDNHITLHATLNLSDGGGLWGAVVGDWTHRYHFRVTSAQADSPGYYGQVLAALNRAVDVLGDEHALEERTLRDTMLGMSFAPQPFVNSGAIAGTFGFYNLALMTGHDARPRDGHPADTVDRLDWRALRRHAIEAGQLVSAAADTEALSLGARFTSQHRSKHQGWSKNRSTGEYVSMQVIGGLAEDRPAAGTLLAMYPRTGQIQNWTELRDIGLVRDYDPLMLEAVDQNGRFRILAARNDTHRELATLGARFSDTGRVTAITMQERLHHDITTSIRVELFRANGVTLTGMQTYDLRPQLLRVLRAATNAGFRDNEVLWGQLGGHTFFYVEDAIVDDRIKVFQPMGPVLLNIAENPPYGAGYSAASIGPAVRLAPIASVDVWRLNEQRLRQLRTRGVSSTDLELLHSRSRQARDDAGELQSLAEIEAAHLQGAALGQKVYGPLRQAMDDLVHAIVLLLLLAIPFAFALERLLVCSTSVYGRIMGFTVAFLITFALLFFMHPGFAIAATPIIIFLAFAIILLSSLVIYLVIRKFRVELKALQGQRVGVHDAEVSHTGTLLAAVGMGMSTMRRRPTRTTLTAITVIMLTFTILGFASFTRTIGVRTVYEGPVTELMPSGMLLRNLDYSELPRDITRLLEGEAGEDGYLAQQWWRVRKSGEEPAINVARLADGRAQHIDAILGVTPEELERWPGLARALGDGSVAEKQAAIEAGGVFLPRIYAELLELELGEVVRIDGRSLTFAGTLDGPELQRLRQLDRNAMLPVNFQNVTAEGLDEEVSETELLVADEVDRDFTYLSADQIAITSTDIVRELGGNLHVLTLYPDDDVDPLEQGRALAELVLTPVWVAGPEGIERMILTVLTEVTGGLALAVPVLLGGLIIFGTLLGSISDREREIYTFSALGLSPGHVGVLFFAEAAVYAVVGGMGGQLLAQGVALVATQMAQMGWIDPPSINYSSTNSLFAIGIVMATVMVSAIYPARRASLSANPGLARAWRMPVPDGDELAMTFPFTVSAYDITGVVSFLAEHFRRHDDAGLGNFAASNVLIRRDEKGNLELSSELALAPFDLGVTQHLVLTAVPSEIEGVDEVMIRAQRLSGARGDWYRSNKVFIRDLRRQFLLWRTLSNEMIERYRMETLQTLGEQDAHAAGARGGATATGPGAATEPAGGRT
ncbi:MAG: FtsX-like permease family protein [Phycisphaeraceae bacterium]